ncbi:hypothetical protein CEB3_c13970 [Peptococcaceae bacterium CEB3]|nr:hypothetical protein CEB3_c13970 [Peptococcaceae bacterium CEB3]
MAFRDIRLPIDGLYRRLWIKVLWLSCTFQHSYVDETLCRFVRSAAPAAVPAAGTCIHTTQGLSSTTEPQIDDSQEKICYYLGVRNIVPITGTERGDL